MSDELIIGNKEHICHCILFTTFIPRIIQSLLEVTSKCLAKGCEQPAAGRVMDVCNLSYHFNKDSTITSGVKLP